MPHIPEYIFVPSSLLMQLTEAIKEVEEHPVLGDEFKEFSSLPDLRLEVDKIISIYNV